MKKNIMLQIPTPCHEDWNNMEVSKQQLTGKFCGSCQKNVVDFTNMSDAQVLAYFLTNKSNTCGRFEPEQLNRVLSTPPPIKKSWYKWVMAALVSGYMFGNKATAQVKQKTRDIKVWRAKKNMPLIGDTITTVALGKFIPPQPMRIESVKINDPIQFTLGAISVYPANRIKRVLHGSVTDQIGSPVAGASVIIKGTQNGAATNKDGQFLIFCENKNPTLLISYVGYQPIERNITPKEIEKLEISANVTQITLKPIVFSQINEIISGSVLIVTKPKKTNKGIDTLHNIFQTITAPINDKLIIAPNPAKPGSAINLSIEKAGNYQLQLFNMQSMLLLSQKIIVEIDGGKTSFNLPSLLTPGEYIVRAIGEKSKIQLSGKLIVQ